MKQTPLSWFKIEISVDPLDIMAVPRLKTDFQRIREILGAPTGLNLFELKTTPTNKDVFFMPPPNEALMGEFVQRYKAVPCEKPAHTEIKPLFLSVADRDFRHWFGVGYSEAGE